MKCRIGCPCMHVTGDRLNEEYQKCHSGKGNNGNSIRRKHYGAGYRS